jgi:hypothetical protein
MKKGIFLAGKLNPLITFHKHWSQIEYARRDREMRTLPPGNIPIIDKIRILALS